MSPEPTPPKRLVALADGACGSPASPAAPVVAIVGKMEAAGRLRSYVGHLVSLEVSGNLIPLRVRKVLNCTGPRTDYSKYQHPFS